MKKFGTANPLEIGPTHPDTVATAVISSAGAVVAHDYPSGAHIMQINSTGGTWLNGSSTGVAIASASSAGSTASEPNERVNSGDYRIITGDSTGYSLTADAAATITVSFWGK